MRGHKGGAVCLLLFEESISLVGVEEPRGDEHHLRGIFHPKHGTAVHRRDHKGCMQRRGRRAAHKERNTQA